MGFAGRIVECGTNQRLSDIFTSIDKTSYLVWKNLCASVDHDIFLLFVAVLNCCRVNLCCSVKLFFLRTRDRIPCCALILLRTYPAVPSFFGALTLPLFYFTLTLLCFYFSSHSAAVPLFSNCALTLTQAFSLAFRSHLSRFLTTLTSRHLVRSSITILRLSHLDDIRLDGTIPNPL